MDLVKPVRPRRSQLNELAYGALNVAMAVAVLLVTLSTQTIWLPLLVILLSKWRVLAVRPRYWWANILANLVDIIVGLGFVVILFAASGALYLQIGLTIAYILWLLFIKPRSKRIFVAFQALVAIFVGTTALASVAYDTNVVIFVAGMWVIGYSAFRHVLMHYDEPLTAMLSMLAGVFMAQLGWFSYHWMFIYTIPGTGVRLAQVAIIAALLAFMSERVYDAHYHRGNKLRMQHVILPVMFSLMLIAVMLVLFNHITPNGSI